MFLGRVTNYTNVVGTDIPFLTELNTNTKTRNSAGVISILERGLWNIDASIEVTGVAGNIEVQLLADGVVRDTRTTTLAGATDTQSVSFADAIRVIFAQYPDVATISMRVDVADAIVNGKLRIENVR